MESLDLSIRIILFQWANLCVDWFMNLFADPDYYWIEDTYPIISKNDSLKNTIQHIIEPSEIKKDRLLIQYFNKAKSNLSLYSWRKAISPVKKNIPQFKTKVFINWWEKNLNYIISASNKTINFKVLDNRASKTKPVWNLIQDDGFKNESNLSAVGRRNI